MEGGNTSPYDINKRNKERDKIYRTTNLVNEVDFIGF
jgi:hypothetical protein